MPWAEIRGVRCYLRILNAEGQDTVVMVHGLYGNHTVFYRCGAKTLADMGYRVVMFDLRGHGMSDFSDREYTLADLAEDLFGVMDYLKIDAAHLVGYSVGANACLKAALMHPERVKSLALVEPSGMKLADLERLPTDVPGVDEFLAEYTESTGITISERNRDDFQRRALELAQRHAKESLLRDVDFFTLADLESIRQPVLLLCGKQSPFADDHELARKRIPEALMKVKTGNHYLPITQSNWLKSEIYVFFSQVQKSVRP